MIISTTTNSSATRIFDIVDMPAVEFTAVELTSDGIQTAGASSVPVGIWNGGSVNVTGGTFWKVGGQSIVAGDLLASDANGFATKATSGQFALAVALTNSAPSSTAEIQIVHAGKV